jgi:endo-1,4-beta-mannosidase
MNNATPLTTAGTFVVGCNYWVSHAGTSMWRDWRLGVVASDLKRLADAGLQVLRVFPLWPDFQPLTALGTGYGTVEYRHGEEALADDEAGQAGVSLTAIQHFAEFADLAQQHGLKLIVALITGWMSGRLFVPPALEGRNVLTDPTAILWQTRLVKYIVQHSRDHPAILAWDLGNECNVMGPTTREQAWVWTAAITNAIRAEDSTRPVVSGMHSLSPNGAWRMQDQGELTDVLTTHPYPYFTPYCDQDPVNTIRTILHSTAESHFYGDIGSKPCLVEEIGTLGPMVASDSIAADFIRAVLFSNWAHDNRGLLWWCAFDLGHLSHAPYDWDAYERELGLIRLDGTPRPVLGELNRFRQFVDGLPIRQLPPRTTEAVCILSEGQDAWAIA